MGNNDIRYERDMEKNRIILADGHKIFMLHGQQLPYGNREKDWQTWLIRMDVTLPFMVILIKHLLKKSMESLSSIQVLY